MKGREDVTGSVNYGSKHATIQNEVLRTNACMFIVCLVEHIRVDIWSARESLLPIYRQKRKWVYSSSWRKSLGNEGKL